MSLHPHFPVSQRTLWPRADGEPAQELTADKTRRQGRTRATAHSLPHTTTELLIPSGDFSPQPRTWGMPPSMFLTSLYPPPKGDLERNGAKQLVPQWMESARKAEHLGHIRGRAEMGWGVSVLRLNTSKDLRRSKPEADLCILLCGMFSFSRWRHWGRSTDDFHADIASNQAVKWELKPCWPKTPGGLPPGPAPCAGRAGPHGGARPQGGRTRATHAARWGSANLRDHGVADSFGSLLGGLSKRRAGVLQSN